MDVSNTFCWVSGGGVMSDEGVDAGTEGVDVKGEGVLVSVEG